ncbi:MAG: AbrB/MazE/SpoVT family DNA-binding domain-containing protein [Mesoaciditoga sp.]|nr:MAG: AbrB/MazE/SpoVT family DNA-binding domain-containing protein [Mesoaciditoga sp.]
MIEDTAKISSKGQGTITAAIRKKLNLKQDDRIFFVESHNGPVIKESTALDEFLKFQKAFSETAIKFCQIPRMANPRT